MMNVFIYIINKVRNVLAFLRGKTFLTFLFFLGVSTAFWFFEVSKEVQTVEMTYPLKLTNVPENVVVTTELPPHVRVRMKAENSLLFYYRYLRSTPIATVNFANYANPTCHVNVPQEDVMSSIRKELKPNTELLSLMPDTIEYYYSFGAKKEVAILFQGKIQTADGFYVRSQKITPSAVTIYAIEQTLDTITVALNEPLYLSDVDKDGSILMNLQKQKGIKVIPDTARLEYTVDRLVEKTLSLPIEVVNFAANKRLRTFPMKVNITFQVGTQDYRDVSVDDFRLVVDGADLASNPSAQTCSLKLLNVPDNVFGIRLQQSEVEYLIEDISDL